jgi:beta-glucosidase
LRQALPDIKIIAVYVGGRPRILDDIVDNVDAMVVSFLPGPSGGEAIADVLVGQTNPAARLPMQWPKYADGGRRTYDTYVTDLCTKSQYEVGQDGDGIPNYEYVECDVQWRFGEGLSYTEFEETFEGAKEDPGMDDWQPPGFLGATFRISPSSTVQFKVKIKNTGSVPGEHVSMMYYETIARSTTPRKEELFSFIRTDIINPGEEVEIVHTLKGEEMKYFDSTSGSHFVYEDGMTSFVKIGNAGSYCRQATGDADGSICLPLKVVVSNPDSGEICGYSCDAWSQTCGEGFSTYESCIAACQQSSREGTPWSWDYVDCAERVAAETSVSGGGCTKIRSECRDVVDGAVADGGSLEVPQVVGGGEAWVFGLGGLIVGLGFGVLGMRQANARKDQMMVLQDFDGDDVEDFSVEMKRMGMT